MVQSFFFFHFHIQKPGIHFDSSPFSLRPKTIIISCQSELFSQSVFFWPRIITIRKTIISFNQIFLKSHLLCFLASPILVFWSKYTSAVWVDRAALFPSVSQSPDSFCLIALSFSRALIPACMVRHLHSSSEEGNRKQECREMANFVSRRCTAFAHSDSLDLVN